MQVSIGHVTVGIERERARERVCVTVGDTPLPEGPQLRHLILTHTHTHTNTHAH
jgi:bifunctional N-acetylglucosamine-1-phosphate-uridyltransferase/glucosamine-1-phosphate-acetyltransferase GlmU-like protein